MNEQMQKLELEAIAYADSKVPANDRYNDIYHSIVRGKFAELIVAECILTIQMGITRDGHNTEKYLRSMKHLKDIKEHFGVEE